MRAITKQRQSSNPPPHLVAIINIEARRNGGCQEVASIWRPFTCHSNIIPAEQVMLLKGTLLERWATYSDAGIDPPETICTQLQCLVGRHINAVNFRCAVLLQRPITFVGSCLQKRGERLRMLFTAQCRSVKSLHVKPCCQHDMHMQL